LLATIVGTVICLTGCFQSSREHFPRVGQPSVSTISPNGHFAVYRKIPFYEHAAEILSFGVVPFLQRAGAVKQ
jgi:hypothetical protein